MNVDEVRQFVNSHIWHHTIDLDEGILTPGGKSQEVLSAEAEAIFKPLNLNGCSVMDVGAWNGFYTVEAKRRGGREVLAVDSPTWLSPYFRGKETFDFVMRRLGLTVQTRILDVQDISEADVGDWDVVLFLGVFYHLFDPIATLRKLAEIANEVLVIETHLDLRECDQPAMVFYPGSELSDDPSNWWGPNRGAAEALLKASGFERVEFTVHPAPGHETTRGIFHAYKSEEAFLWHTGQSGHLDGHAVSAEARPRVKRRADHPLSSGEVTALYEILLGRSAEGQEAIDTQLSLHRSAISLARSICDSDEFRVHVKRERGSPITRADVKALYEILLGRAPESDGMIETQRRLHNSTISLALSICGSAEAYPRSIGLVGAPPTKAQVLALYQILFRQTSESDEIVDEQLQLHRSSISLARWLCDPDQIRLRLNSEPDAADIRAVYQIVLGRLPEADEATRSSLHNSVISLAQALCDTDEFRERVKGDAERPLKRAEARQLFEIVLGRKASSKVIENLVRRHDSAVSLARSLCQSEKFRLWIQDGTEKSFCGYPYEEIPILRRHLVHSKPETGFLKDFVGTRMRVEFNTAVSHLNGVVVDRLPIPGDFRAAAIEWIGVLKATESSGAHFVTVELGAGWGPWVVASGHVARRLGKTVRMYAVEADPGKVGNIAQHMIDNGFDPKDHVIFGGIVGPRDGFAYFPVIDATGNWGGEAVYRTPPQGNYHKLPSISLRSLMKDEKSVDLIHFDIQGAEFDAVQGSIDDLCSKVKWMVIGTHSRSIEGKLVDLLLKNNWSMENEQPCRCSYTTGHSQILIDGTQVWRNHNRQETRPLFHSRQWLHSLCLRATASD